MVAFNFVKGIFIRLGVAGTATVALLILSVIGLWLAFQENFNNIHKWVQVTWEGIKSIINGEIDIIKGYLKLFWSIITLDLDGIKESFSLIWEGISGVVEGVINFIIGLMVTLGTGVLRGLKVVKDYFEEKFGEIVTSAIQWGKDIASGIFEGLKSMGSSIKNWFSGLFSRVSIDTVNTSPSYNILITPPPNINFFKSLFLPSEVVFVSFE